MLILFSSKIFLNQNRINNISNILIKKIKNLSFFIFIILSYYLRIFLKFYNTKIFFTNINIDF